MDKFVIGHIGETKRFCCREYDQSTDQVDSNYQTDNFHAILIPGEFMRDSGTI